MTGTDPNMPGHGFPPPSQGYGPQPGHAPGQGRPAKRSPELFIAIAALVGMVIAGAVLALTGDNTEQLSSSSPTSAPTVPSSTSVEQQEPSRSVSASSTVASTVPVSSQPRPSTSTPAPTSTPSMPTASTAAPAPTEPTSAVPAPTAPASSAPTTAAALVQGQQAEQALRGLLQSDAAAVAAVEDKWVPQVSAKQVGLEWKGVVYGHEQILADHQKFRNAYGAVLVDGGTYNFRRKGSPMTGWYMTVIPQGFDSPNGALAWCVSQKLSRDDCFAKLITKRLNAGETVVLQPAG